MPHRIQAMHEAVAMILGAVSMMTASIVALLGDIPVQAFNGPAILDNERFRLVCLIGAVGGAVLNLGMYPSKTPGIRPMAWQFTCSVLCGVFLTPMVMHWAGSTANFDTLSFTSFVVAIGGVGFVQKIIPLLWRALLSKLGLVRSDVPPQCVPPPPAVQINPPPNPPAP